VVNEIISSCEYEASTTAVLLSRFCLYYGMELWSTVFWRFWYWDHNWKYS